MCKQTSESDCVCVCECAVWPSNPINMLPLPVENKFLEGITLSPRRKNTVSNLCVRVCVCVYSLWLHVMNDLKNNLQSYSPE